MYSCVFLRNAEDICVHVLNINKCVLRINVFPSLLNSLTINVFPKTMVLQIRNHIILKEKLIEELKVNSKKLERLTNTILTYKYVCNCLHIFDISMRILENTFMHSWSHSLSLILRINVFSENEFNTFILSRYMYSHSRKHHTETSYTL